VSWHPQGKTAQILGRAWYHCSSVSYSVSLRWLFYRLLQDGIFRNKADYKRLKDSVMAPARKNFHGPWRPWTLADETRAGFIEGDGYAGEDEWLTSLADGLVVEFDKWSTQAHYIAIAFEAKAMLGQFRQYAPGITLFPCGGDPSIPFKWEIARHLSAKAEKYQVPVKLFYFGDLDPKGLAIPESLLRDIQA